MSTALKKESCRHEFKELINRISISKHRPKATYTCSLNLLSTESHPYQIALAITNDSDAKVPFLEWMQFKPLFPTGSVHELHRFVSVAAVGFYIDFVFFKVAEVFEDWINFSSCHYGILVIAFGKKFLSCRS